MKITQKLREELKKPLGYVTDDTNEIPKAKVTVCIGDFASKRLLKEGFKPDIIVYDGRTKRQDIGIAQEIKSHEGTQQKLINPQGELVKEAFTLFRKAFKSGEKTKIFVVGEEDLTALAAIKEAPNGAVIVYGQPNEGLVVVEVEDKIKNKITKIIKEMENGD